MRIGFDLDGTLLTCENRQSAVLRACAQSCGIKLNTSAVWKLKREGLSTYKALLVHGLDPSVADIVVRRWHRDIESPSWQLLDSLIDGVRPVLSELNKNGHSLFLLTARSRAELVDHTLRRNSIRQHFDDVVIVSAETVIVQEKAAAIKREKAEIFVGDTESDYMAAKLAGVRFAAVDTGQRSRAFLFGSGVGMCYSQIKNVFTDIFI